MQIWPVRKTAFSLAEGSKRIKRNYCDGKPQLLNDPFICIKMEIELLSLAHLCRGHVFPPQWQHDSQGDLCVLFFEATLENVWSVPQNYFISLLSYELDRVD